MNADFFSWERFADVFPKVLVKLPVTFEIVLMATVIGLCLGTILAMIRIKKIPVLNQIAFPVSYTHLILQKDLPSESGYGKSTAGEHAAHGWKDHYQCHEKAGNGFLRRYNHRSGWNRQPAETDRGCGSCYFPV